MTKSLTGAALSLALLAAAAPERTAVLGVTAGGTHNVALSSDGTVWTWGDGTPAMTPVARNGFPGFRSLVAGRGRTAILASDGTVWSWKATGQDQASVEGVMPAPGLSGVRPCRRRETTRWLGRSTDPFGAGARTGLLPGSAASPRCSRSPPA